MSKTISLRARPASSPRRAKAADKSNPLAFLLVLLKGSGLSGANKSSDLRAWAKRLEKEDAKLGLSASRIDAFLSHCVDRFPCLPIERADLLSGKVKTPADIVARLQDKVRRKRGDDGQGATGAGDLVTAGLTKEQFLTQNRAALDRILRAVAERLRAKYGASFQAISRHDLCVVFYCECGLKNGKVDPDYRHSEGERGLLPLPDNITSWNGADAPAWNQPMSPATNLLHFFLYMGHLKNKDLTGAPRHLYRGCFVADGIRGNATISAKVLAGVVHGYFYRGTYSDNQVPFDYLMQSYRDDKRLSVFMAATKYRHAGTSVMTGRERNIDTGLSLV